MLLLNFNQEHQYSLCDFTFIKIFYKLLFQCSHTCGPGVRQRYLVCKRVDYRGNTIATRDKYCEKSTRPKVSTEESCKLMVCPHKMIEKPNWKVSPWSQVSGSSTILVHVVTRKKASIHKRNVCTAGFVWQYYFCHTWTCKEKCYKVLF